MKTQVAIIGAGLSGLYSAYLLDELGIDYVIVEARSRIGGRVLSHKMNAADDAGTEAAGAYDLGPSWIWPEINPRLKQLVEQFQLEVFAQHASGAYVMETSRELPVNRYNNGFVGQPESMRLAGGVNALIEAISNKLNTQHIHINAQVERISQDGDGLSTLVIQTASGQQKLQAEQVITAMPLRLLGETIEFFPSLPSAVLQQFSATPTWMAAHAKFFAIYDQAFWREQGLSGSAGSRVGPLAEIHDASPQVGQAALFGFVGIDAATRKSVGEKVLKQAAIEQLTHIFGAQAGKPIAVELLDWSQQVFTATKADQAQGGHPRYGLSSGAQALSQRGLFIAGTEAAAQYGGYLEGALEAAQDAISKLRSHREMSDFRSLIVMTKQ